MLKVLRIQVTALLVLSGAFVFAQQRSGIAGERDKTRSFDLSDLAQEDIELPGQGKMINGIALRSIGRPRIAFVDDSSYARRDIQDTTWALLRDAEDSLVTGVRTWWVRYHLHPDADLKEVPVILSLGSTADAEVFLNGHLILRTGSLPLLSAKGGMPRSDSLPHASVPFTFQCDGQTEVIALRLAGPPNNTLRSLGCEVLIHRPDTIYRTQRTVLHFGVFVGVNLIILVLSIVIWSQERRETSWLFLALLAIIEAVDSVVDLSGEMGFLGFPDDVSRVLGSISIILIPWPLYLLIMVLRKLQGDLDQRSAKWYTRSVLFVSGVCALIAVIGSSWPDGYQPTLSDGTFDEPITLVLVILAAVGGLLFVVVLAWFAMVAIRLAIRLLRKKGYERWIGGGALASSVLTILFKIGSGIGDGISSWTGIAALYCDHVAVPLSAAIYLAIRSAHHSRAVARQRDDLDREVHERTAQLSEAKKRSDDLLLNILPYEVAEELKQTGSAAARHFDEVTVMFTDFKGFTAMSERVAPGELLEELNTCFRAFDDIIARHGIEKIKTIGDSYMCAAGLPHPGSSSPAAVVFAALEMQDFMHARQKTREDAGQLAFIMRVGIHTGPVVAGIVGVKKFQYDIWGDTVNTASRMESSGEAGHVNISDATFSLVKGETGLSFIPRGKVGVKGKGEMDMYFVQKARY